MMAVIIQYSTDNVAPNATWSVNSGTVDTNYPAANIADRKLHKPAKLTTTSGAWMADFGAAQRIDVVALGPHNLSAGLAVYIQGNASDSWGTPTVNASLTIPARTSDNQSVDVWLDLTGVTGYSTGGFRYWRLYISGTNSVAVAIGEIWLGALKRVPDRAYRWGFKIIEDHPSIEHRTEVQIPLTYPHNVRLRAFDCTFRASENGKSELLEWSRSMRGRQWSGLFIPNSGVKDAWWVRMSNVFEKEAIFTGAHDINMILEETPHGVAL